MTTPTLENLDYAWWGRPCFGERVSGDAVVIEERENLLFMAIVDVLGHGPDAHSLACKITTLLKQTWSYDLPATMLQLHQELKGTLGAAASLSILDVETDEFSYLGVGNTAIRLFGRDSRRLCSTDGIIGNHIRKPITQKLTLGRSQTVLLYTDGIKDRFELSDYPQLIYESSQLVAQNVVKRFNKVYDDATCIALKYKKCST